MKYLESLCVVHEAGKHDDAKDQEEHEEGELLGRRLERVNEDLEAWRMAGQFEQPQDADYGEELEDVRLVYAVRHAALQEDVRVEAESSHEVYHVHWGLDELQQIRADLQPGTECSL